MTHKIVTCPSLFERRGDPWSDVPRRGVVSEKSITSSVRIDGILKKHGLSPRGFAAEVRLRHSIPDDPELDAFTKASFRSQGFHKSSIFSMTNSGKSCQVTRGVVTEASKARRIANILHRMHRESKS